MESFLLQATIYLGTAVIAVPIASRLGLGSVLGYLLAGIMIGPSVLQLVGTENQGLQHFAEFGVVMMLFLIGLELEPRTLWDMRHRLLGLGGSQIALTIALVAGIAIALGQTWQVGLAIGMILTLSSTAIVLQTLKEKNLMQTSGGRSAFSVLLTQDIAVIPMLALMPLLAIAMPGTTSSAATDHTTAMSLVEGLPGWGVTLVTLGAVGAIILAGIFLIRPLFRYIDGAHLREMYTALALLIVVGIGFLMSLVGLSPALGTFLAGVVLANSEFRHELESDIEPFKGLLLGLFFITVGASINFTILFANPLVVISLTVGLMTLKGAILFGLGKAFNLQGRDQWLFTLGLAQAGEFGFVLVSFSVQQHVLPADLSEIILLVIALSMLLTPLFFILYEVLSKRTSETKTDTKEDEIDEQNTIIIAGIGRFGQVVNRLVQSAGFSTTVLDHDLKTVQLMRTFGAKAYFGDPTRPELLHSAGLDSARVLIVALDDKNAALKLVRYVRSMRPDIHIVARAIDRLHVFELYRAGANDIVRELFDSSLRAGRFALEHLGLSDYEAHQAEVMFYQMDREAMRDLAELWDPKIPITKNKPYVNRAKELNKDMETAFLAMMEPDKEAK
ncbi:MAG: monovalent cation:proton antiporter-2 (CPA2) family protein [Paracoccaceae bacterium]